MGSGLIGLTHSQDKMVCETTQCSKKIDKTQFPAIFQAVSVQYLYSLKHQAKVKCEQVVFFFFFFGLSPPTTLTQFTRH